MLATYSAIVIYATSMDFTIPVQFSFCFCEGFVSGFFSNICVTIFALGRWETSP